MTATTTARRAGTIARRGQVPWRRLAWVTWRQHRGALIGMLLVFLLAGALLIATGIPLHGPSAWRVGHPWSRYFAVALNASVLLHQAIPVLAGMFLGAPLLAREAELGTSRLAWTQGVGLTRWLLAKIVPLAVLSALAAAGLARELSWWLGQFRSGYVVSPWGYPSQVSWGPALFDLHPLPFAGWVTLGLGVFLGAVIRRTVPAMAATLACYMALGYAAMSWRTAYLAPLRRTVPVQFSPGGGYGYSGYWGSRLGPGPDILTSNLGWPNGRPISSAQVTQHSAAWLTVNHIKLWVTYQPASRFSLFQAIEFGWLIVLAAILITATVVLIRRRAA